MFLTWWTGRRTTSDKLLYNKLFEITSNPKHCGYQKNRLGGL